MHWDSLGVCWGDLGIRYSRCRMRHRKPLGEQQAISPELVPLQARTAMDTERDEGEVGRFG
jgi:hypothetical protein